MLERLKGWMGLEAKGANPQAPAQPGAKGAAPAGGSAPGGNSILEPAKPPKFMKGEQTIPSYLKIATPSETTPLPLTDRALANKDLLTLRSSATTSRATVREFVAASPDLSAAVNAYVRTAITSNYTAVAKNPDGSFNRDATALLKQLLVKFDVLPDYSVGFGGFYSLRTLSEMFVAELQRYGSCGAELVLDKNQLPAQITPVSTFNIKLYPADNAMRLVPKQYLAGEYIDLDIPTFFYIPLDQDPLEPYSNSPLETALQPVLFQQEFMNDVRRIVKKVIHPRNVLTIDEDKFRKNIPPKYLYDPEGLAGYLELVKTDLAGMVNGLNPEDALILMDTIGLEIVDHGSTNLSKEYEVLSGIADAKLATAAKVLPSILGHGSQSANIASAEVLLFMKFVQGAAWAKLNELYSRIFTLAVRLYGFDVFVEFAYDQIDLRPDSELEAFKAMKQSRILEQLSLGFISDDEASIALTGNMTPPGMKPLSGTMFRNNAVVGTDNPNNGSTNNGSTMNHNLEPDTPTQPKSQNQGKGPGNVKVVK